MMKKMLTSLLMIYAAATISGGGKVKAENLKIVPLLTSTPTSGTGVGAIATCLYETDKESSPSQLIVAGEYTNTDSYGIFAINRAFFSADRIMSVTSLAYAINRSRFNYSSADLPIELPVPIPPGMLDSEIRFDVGVASVGQMMLFETAKHLFIGGHTLYVTQNYSNANLDGDLFLKAKGVENSSRGSVGVDFAYDTRLKNEKYYPYNAIWAQLILSAFPEALGSEENYYSAVLNARIYTPGFKPSDVWANQFFGKYVTKNAPDAGLAALGARSVLRGFAVGQFKARLLSALQTEYRYQIEKTRFKLVAFAGAANLSGGSKGTTYQTPNGNTKTFNRDGDNGNYYSGGLGIRYTIQPEAGIDFRVDMAYSSENEASIYAQINQAF